MPDVEQQHDSFLDLNLDEVPDLSAVPADEEYRLKVSDAKIGTSKGAKTSGQQYVLIYFDIADVSDTKRVTYPIMLPSPEEDEETNNGRKRQMKAFLQALGFDISQGFNVDELVGEECWAILDIEDDPQYGERNSVKRFVNSQGGEG